MSSDTVVFMYHWAGVDEKVFEHHFQALVKSNPTLDVVRFNSEDTQDAYWNKIRHSKEGARTNCDLVIYDFYRQHPNYKHYMYMEWDAYCMMDLRKLLDPVKAFHIASHASVHPGYGSAPWFNDQIRELPAELRPLAMSMTPLNGIYLSQEALRHISKPHPMCQRNVRCEVRVSVLARLHGFEPAHYPVCPRSIDGYPALKGKFIVGESLWHPVKFRTLPAYIPPADCPAIGLWMGSHPHWVAVINLRADGRLLMNGKDAGRWVYFDDGELTLMWDNYAPERLKRTSEGFAENGFSLTRLDTVAAQAKDEKAKTITCGPLLSDAAFKVIADKLSVRKTWYFHQSAGSLGDRLVTRGTHQFFHKFGLNVLLNPMPDIWDPTEVGLIASGGGSLGIYKNVIAERDAALSRLNGSSTPIVILPQSGNQKLSFPDTTTLFASEAATQALYPGAVLAPDMALFATLNLPEVTPHRKFGIFLRNDVEGIISLERGRDPCDLFGTIEEGARAIQQCRTIVTDRLHFAILALILKREVVLLPNSYHKNRSMYETWLKGLGCKWADDAVEWTGERTFKRADSKTQAQ